MMRRLMPVLTLVAVAALVVTPLLAQSATTGSFSGTVVDEDGGVLPGVTITATYVPTNTTYTGVSRENGRFAIPNVRAGGPYRVVAELEGFQNQTLDGVNADLGADTNLEFTLPLEVSEEVTVTASAFIAPNRMGSASNVGEMEIENLPSISRGLEDFARTNPFFTVASENEDSEAISVAGRSGRYNNIQIDGAVNNDLFGLADQGTPGGQAETTPISLDAIQEIQLVLSSFDVRQGGFSGGSINAVTRSGTNDWKGSAFYYTRDDGLVGDVESLGEFGTFSEDQYGLRLGGPISRDRSFFFVNAEKSEKSEPTGWSLDGSGGQCFADCMALDDAQRFRDLLIDNFGYDPGGFGQQTRETPSDKFFGRLDFNLSDSHQLTVRHNYVDAENDVNFPSSGTFEFTSETYLFTSETNSTVGQLNSTLSPTMFNEARLTRQTVRENRGGVQQPFPWIEIEDVEGEEFEAGTEPFSTANALDQDIIEITDDFTWLWGDHTFTFGTHNEFFSFDNLFIQNLFGAYEFRNLDDFEAAVNGADTVRRWNYTEVAPGQSPSQKFDVQQYGLYAGDQWAVRDNLTLSYGLRVDIPFFPDTPTRNPFTETTFGYRTSEIPDGKQLWQPRVGFNWDVEGNGKAQLRGGAGIFAGRTPYVWISNVYARTGIEQTFYTAFDVPFIADPFGQQPNTTQAGTSIGEFNLIDPDFEFPQLMRLNLAYDRELPWWGIIGSVEAVYSDSIEEIDYKDVNLVQTGVSPVDGRPIYGGRVDSGVTGAYLITNSSKGDATNFAVKLERPVRSGIGASVSYAYGDSNVINDGTSSRAVSNFQFTEAADPNNVGLSTSDFEVEHRFTATFTKLFNRNSRYPTTVSAFYNLQSGRPVSYIFGFQQFPSVNADAYFSNDLMYVPTGADDVVITNGTWEQLDAFINSSSCLDSHRGGIAPRNCDTAPWNQSLDVRLAQDIPAGPVNVQLTLDVLNVLNLLDEDSGHFRYANFNTMDPVDWLGISDDGHYIYELNSEVLNNDDSRWETHNIRSRWRAKLGVRITY
ncbi:MAG: TonB-dependent receptor [Thermoanaerobaculia bacterium]